MAQRSPQTQKGRDHETDYVSGSNYSTRVEMSSLSPSILHQGSQQMHRSTPLMTFSQNRVLSPMNTPPIRSIGTTPTGSVQYLQGSVTQQSTAAAFMQQQGVSHSVYQSHAGMYSPAVSMSNLGYQTRKLSGNETILNETIIEHEIKVPKRIVREDVVEKVVVVPERRVVEEMVDEVYNVREKVVEIMKPIIRERIVEVPEIEYVEKEVEVPEYVIQEKICQVPVVRYEERIRQVPKIVEQQRIVEVPQIEYREVPFEKIIEVPEYREEVRYVEVPRTQYVDKPVPEPYIVEVPQKSEYKIPVPIEAVSTFSYKIPKLQPKYTTVDLVLYVPRFIEVPVPAEFMDIATLRQAEVIAAQVGKLAQQKTASLCEVETVAGQVKNSNFSGILEGTTDFVGSLNRAWHEGRLRTVAC